MTAPTAGFAAPVLVVVDDAAAGLWPVLSDGLEASGHPQPEPAWVEDFQRHVRIALAQSVADGDDGLDLAVGDLLLWLGHRLYLGHGMLVEASFAREVRGLLDRLVVRGLAGVVLVTVSDDESTSDWPSIRLDEEALRAEPARSARVDVLDRLGQVAAVG